MTDSGGSQRTARIVLIGFLALGMVLIALVLALTVRQGTAPATQPPPRLTNTPNVGAGGITPVEPGLPAPDVTLPASGGGELALSDLRGRYVFLYFGYTHCPDYCPTTMAKWAQVKRALGEAAEDVAFVMISIDPRRDTPDVIAEYLAQFDPAFIGLQGNEGMVTALAGVFGLAAAVPNGAEATESAHGDQPLAGHDEADIPTYLVDHTVSSYLLDPAGNLRAIFHPTTPAADMRAYLESIQYADTAEQAGETSSLRAA